MLVIPSPHGTQKTDPHLTVTREGKTKAAGGVNSTYPWGGSAPSTASCTLWHFTYWLNNRGNPATHNRDWNTSWTLTNWENTRGNTATHTGNWDISSWNSTSWTSNTNTCTT